MKGKQKRQLRFIALERVCMDKYKLKDKKKPLPPSDSYCGLPTEDWEKLNAGGSVSLSDVPIFAEEYLIKEKKEK